MNMSIEGALKNFNKVWSLFSHNGKQMEKGQVRKILRYAFNKGYKCTLDLSDSEIDSILNPPAK